MVLFLLLNLTDVKAKTAEEWFEEGKLLHSQEKIEEAIECYNNAIKLKPEYLDAILNKGIAFYEIEKYIGAFGKSRKAVFIDGMYNIDTGSSGVREASIERANKIKAMSDKFRIPIICTAEVRKKPQNNKTPTKIDDIMESGKFAYNANLVWILRLVISRNQ